MSSAAPWDIVKGHHHLAMPELDHWNGLLFSFPAIVRALGYASKWNLYIKTSKRRAQPLLLLSRSNPPH